jgi:NitT/TauT family transport system ATP-binding protein
MMIAQLKAVEVAYGRGPALGPVDLDLAAEEVVALVGPSGCGKSTAMRLLAGLEQPGAGRVERSIGKGQTSLVFQAPTLAPWLTALDNVALPLRLSGQSGEAARRRAGDCLAQVGLKGAVSARPAQLSGGMAMRVSLARALATEPKLLLLDEPFAALDEITRRTLADDVLALWARSRPAILFVTHNVEEAVYMAQRVLVMSPGPGRIVGDFRTPGDLPRPETFRTSAAFRETVEAVSQRLAESLKAAA